MGDVGLGAVERIGTVDPTEELFPSITVLDEEECGETESEKGSGS
jgi:hypothetical protein